MFLCMKVRAYCTTILYKSFFASIYWKEEIMYAMNLCILYIVCIGVCHMYNETIFKFLSCDTEQS